MISPARLHGTKMTTQLLRPMNGWTVPCVECNAEVGCTLGWPVKERGFLGLRQGPPWILAYQDCPECGLAVQDMERFWERALGRYWWQQDPMPPHRDVRDQDELGLGLRLWYWLAQSIVDRLVDPKTLVQMRSVFGLEEGSGMLRDREDSREQLD